MHLIGLLAGHAVPAEQAQRQVTLTRAVSHCEYKQMNELSCVELQVLEIVGMF